MPKVEQKLIGQYYHAIFCSTFSGVLIIALSPKINKENHS